MKTARPLITVKEFKQVGIVVGNLDQRMETMWNVFGIGPWSVYVYEQPDNLIELKYYGRPSRSGFRIAKAMVGALEIELLEPIGTDNIYYDFLQKHGEGIQHLGHHEVQSPQEVAEITAILERAGFPTVWSGRSSGAVFAYVDTTKALNTVLEVIWRDPAAEKPSPRYIFPAQ